MAEVWLWTCETCGAKTATDCDKINAADVRCAMCGSSLVGDEQKGMAVVKADRLAALERIASYARQYRKEIANRPVEENTGIFLMRRNLDEALMDLARMEDEAKC